MLPPQNIFIPQPPAPPGDCLITPARDPRIFYLTGRAGRYIMKDDRAHETVVVAARMMGKKALKMPSRRCDVAA